MLKQGLLKTYLCGSTSWEKEKSDFQEEIQNTFPSILGEAVLGRVIKPAPTLSPVDRHFAFSQSKALVAKSETILRHLKRVFKLFVLQDKP